MFLDASAVVAVLTREEEAEALLAKITGFREPIHYSSVTMFEAVIGISRKTAISLYGDQRPTPPEPDRASSTGRGGVHAGYQRR